MSVSRKNELRLIVFLLACLSTAETEIADSSLTLTSSFRAIFTLDVEEGACFLQVLQTESGTEPFREDSFGWVEVWQEGHRLMVNTTDMEVAISTRGIDTYLWASVFDDQGRWIASSNVLHTGHHAGVELVIDDSVHESTWYEGDRLDFDFRLPLDPDVESYEVDSIICIINNQTVGKMGMSQTITRDNERQVWRFAHDGQVEVGRHSLSLALLPPHWGVPSVLSGQTWFRVAPRPLEVFPLASGSAALAAARQDSEGLALAGCDNASFHECLVKAQRRLPPNRQYTELFDAADACAWEHCAAAGADDATLQRAMAGPLLAMLDEHWSAVAGQRQVEESLMRAARALFALGERRHALRALRSVLRLVGYGSAPPVRQQCTYPGCNEMAKDACTILSRLLSHKGAAVGSAAAASYRDFLRLIIPPSTLAPPLPPHPPRYSLSDVVFGVLSTQPSYRARADVVKATWWPFVAKGHFYGDAPDAALPITPYRVFEGAGAGAGDEVRLLWEEVMAADYASSHPKFFMALLDMFLRHPAAPWFFLGGDDNFVVPSSLLALLHHLDADDNLIVGGPLGQHIGVGPYPAGGSGILFSNGFLRAVWRRLPAFAASWREQRGKHMLCHPCGDVSFGFLARDAGARVVEVPCLHGMWPEYFALHSSPQAPSCAAVVGAAPKPFILCPRPASFHYVQPRAMRLLAGFFFRDGPPPAA